MTSRTPPFYRTVIAGVDGTRSSFEAVRQAARLVDPSRAHAGGLAALRAAGGSTVADLPERVDLVVDGITGIGSSGGLRPNAAALAERLPELRAADGDRPPVVAVSGGRSRVLVRRETEADLLACDMG